MPSSIRAATGGQRNAAVDPLLSVPVANLFTVHPVWRAYRSRQRPGPGGRFLFRGDASHSPSPPPVDNLHDTVKCWPATPTQSSCATPAGRCTRSSRSCGCLRYHAPPTLSSARRRRGRRPCPGAHRPLHHQGRSGGPGWAYDWLLGDYVARRGPLLSMLATGQYRVSVVCNPLKASPCPPKTFSLPARRGDGIEETPDLQAAIGKLDVRYVTGAERERS